MSEKQVSTGLKFFVGGIPIDTKKKDLQDYFQSFGKVRKVTRFNPNHGRKLSGFCFIKFDTLYSDKIYDKSCQFKFKDRVLEIDPVLRRRLLRRQAGERFANKIFLPHLPPSLSKEDLILIFSCYSTVTNCVIIERKQAALRIREDVGCEHEKLMHTNQPTFNFGFICFEKREAAQMLIEQGSVQLDSKTILEIQRYSPNPEKSIAASGLVDAFSLEASRHRHFTSEESTPRATLHRERDHYLKPTQKRYFSSLREEPILSTSLSRNTRFNLPKFRI